MDRDSRYSYLHRGGDSALIGATIDESFRRAVAEFPEREAVVSIPQGVRRSYAEFDRDVDRLARGLMALGLRRGDRVGVWSPDNLEWVALQLATARVGIVLVNINPAYRGPELRHALRLARVQAVFTIPRFKSSRYVEMLLEVCPEARAAASPEEFASAALPELRHIVVWDPNDAQSAPGRRMPADVRGLRTWPDVLRAAERTTDRALQDRMASLDFDDPINIQFTSGTTGAPKAVLLTHHNLVNNAWFTGAMMRFTEHDRLCVPVPFYHCFGMVISNLLCLIRGAAIVIPAPHFQPGATLAAIQDEKCTAIHGVPTMFIAELECESFADYDLSSLRTGIMAGAPCPVDVLRRVVDDMGCAGILVSYGQTEASPVTHSSRLEDPFERRIGTVGTNLPHTESKIVDPHTGAIQPRGEPGEICVRGYHVMRGYFEQPEATREALDEAGWLHTGDIGVMDDGGYVSITGRLKNMIIRGGENVYPAEIEAFFHGHPKVADIAVFGVPDERAGEEVAAWIKLHPGTTAEPEEFREFAQGSIAHFKVPRYIWIVDDFPLTVTGKVQKFKIRESAMQMLEASATPDSCGTT